MPLPDKGSYNEVELLTRLADGDEKAFNAIYQRYNAMIFSAAMVYVKDIAAAQEIVQQIFVKLWEKRAIVPNIDNFQNYIIVTSRNLIYDQFRKTNSEARKIAELAKREDHIAPETGAGRTEEREFSRIVAAAVIQLPPQQKRIYLLIQEEQLSYKEVARHLGLSVFTIKKHLELARRAVREYVIKNSLK